MFRRKKHDGDDGNIIPPLEDATAGNSSAIPPRVFVRPSSGPAMPPIAPRTTAPGIAAARGPLAPVGRAAIPMSDSGESKKLIVGREIVLAGQITSCERLVVEGRVEAALTDCRAIEISEAGLFKGSAEVATADISGRFEGNLTVRERLSVRATGRIDGQIRYGQIEIEPGGEISGDVRRIGARGAAGGAEKLGATPIAAASGGAAHD